MSRMVKFKGGPVALNSGGQGPDDYLLKPIYGGQWTLVIFRFGRNFRWSPDGRVEDLAEAQENGKIDYEMMKEIFPIQQICVGDNQRRLVRMKKRENGYPIMSAADFFEKYGDSPLIRVR